MQALSAPLERRPVSAPPPARSTSAAVAVPLARDPETFKSSHGCVRDTGSTTGALIAGGTVPQRVSLPPEARGEFYAMVLSALMVFAVVGLCSGLAGLFLAGPLHHSSHAMLGAVLFAAFSAGAVGQLVTIRWSPLREAANPRTKGHVNTT